MTILVTGSRGKTASELTSMLTPQYPVLIASRSLDKSCAVPMAKFDWSDSATYGNPFEHEQAKRSPITAVYLVGLDTEDGADLVMSFVHFAIARGVRRFVLLTATEAEEGGLLLGKAHAELHRLGDAGTIEWAVVRPHFFVENFIEKGYGGYQWQAIMKEGRIYSAAGDGRIPWLSARDIAAVAYRALIDEKPHNTDHYITGPQSLSYDDVAAIFSGVLGREIVHIRKSPDELVKFHVDSGLPESFAQILAALDQKFAGGYGGRTPDVVEQVTGRPPRTLKEFLVDNKHEFDEAQRTALCVKFLALAKVMIL